MGATIKSQVKFNNNSVTLPVVFVALLVGLVASTMHTHAATVLFNTDCMKNPFASGCRGISAKRSVAGPNWPAGRRVRPTLDEYELYRLLGAAISSPSPLQAPSDRRREISSTITTTPSVNQQLVEALELLTDAASSLLACDSHIQQQQQQLRSHVDQKNGLQRVSGGE